VVAEVFRRKGELMPDCRVVFVSHANPEDNAFARWLLNRTGFIGGLIPREDGAHAPTQQVLPGAA